MKNLIIGVVLGLTIGLASSSLGEWYVVPNPNQNPEILLPFSQIKPNLRYHEPNLRSNRLNDNAPNLLLKPC